MNLPTSNLNTKIEQRQVRDGTPAMGVRIAEVAALARDGRIISGQRRIPTLSVFDMAFAAFAQGTIFHTEGGLKAVEDLRPGDWLTTSGGDREQITWIGSASFSPHDPGERTILTRVMPDSFGVTRPETFVSFGPAARLLQTPPDLRAGNGIQNMMTPVAHFIDGTHVIEATPPAPIRLFHVATRRHAALLAGGLEVESYHPGRAATERLSNKLSAVFVSLFPHLEGLGDFGPLIYARAPQLPSLAG